MALEDYEAKIKLIDKLVKTEEAIAEIEDEIEVLEQNAKDAATIESLEKIKAIIEGLEE